MGIEQSVKVWSTKHVLFAFIEHTLSRNITRSAEDQRVLAAHFTGLQRKDSVILNRYIDSSFFDQVHFVTVNANLEEILSFREDLVLHILLQSEHRRGTLALPNLMHFA